MMLTRELLALLGPLFLTGCLLSPGKFTSELDLRSNGDFTFSYEGEIHFLALSEIAKGAEEAAGFESYCFDDDTGESRECTADELAQQKAEWEASEAEKAQYMQALLGGVDLTDPEAAKELTEMLERQSGWNSVEHRGDGVFDVDYAISGTLSHGFSFPQIENMPSAGPFVSIFPRKNNMIRIDATGFALKAMSDPVALAMLAPPGGMPGESGQGTIAFDKMEGVFTIRTDGRIMANNTDEGPMDVGGMQVLSWQVNGRTETAPTALIAID